MSLLAGVLHVPASLEISTAWIALVDYGTRHERWQAAAVNFRTQIGDAPG